MAIGGRFAVENVPSSLPKQLMEAGRSVRDAKNACAEAAAHRAVDVAKEPLVSAGRTGGRMEPRTSTDTWRRTRPTRPGTSACHGR
jgi:hypothetical protein